jgi:hypothetical protein
MKGATKKQPSECKFYKGRNFFMWLMDDFPQCSNPDKLSGICIFKNCFTHCPYYEPKEKKENGNN